MTEQTTPTGGEAQPIADANSIESIVDSAEIESKTPEIENPEADPEQEDPWPKKAENALAKAKGKAAQLRAERDQERAARQRAEQQLAKFNGQQQKDPDKSGEPQEKDFTNYHDYLRALNKFDAEQLLSTREVKQQETQRTTQEQAWVSERESIVATKAQETFKQVPDAQSTIEEHADIADDFSPALQRLFLEADNAPLAFYNLAKEGKLESLMNMSLARAAMEIGRAQTQAPPKPQTKAPAPLPASRGSVAGAKKLEDMDGDGIRTWMKA